MVQPLMTFATRRWILVSLTAAVVVAASAGFAALSLSLGDTAFVSGWMLLVMVLFLTIYNVRKKLTYPPLVKSSTWLQVHVYVGLLSIVMFGLHIGLRIPNGVIEMTLAALYTGAAVSGVLGLALSRIIPGRLTGGGNEVLFERIPRYRRELQQRAEALVLQSVGRGHVTLSDFYTRRLAAYFGGPANAWGQLVFPARRVRRLQEELNTLGRYLDDQDREVLRELGELVAAKSDLDAHRAQQGVLKLWLFVHIPLTYTMLVFIAVHVVLVHAFAGGLS